MHTKTKIANEGCPGKSFLPDKKI